MSGKQVGRVSFIIVVVLSFFINFDSAAYIPIMANYAVSLGATYFLAGIIVGLYSAIQIPSNIIFGRLSDRLGRKKPMIFGFLLDGLASLVYYMAESPLHLIFGRIIHGLGSGFGGPASMSYLGDATPRSKGSRVMAIYGIVIGLSYLVGMMMGGILSTYLGYKHLFLSMATFMGLAGVLSMFIEESLQEKLVSRSIRSEIEGVIRLFSNRLLLSGYLAIFALSVSLGVLASSFAMIVGRMGYEDMHVGMFFGLGTLVSMFVQYPSGVLGDRYGRLKMLIVGLALQGVGMVFLTLLTFRFIILGMVVWGVGHGFVFPNVGGIIRSETEFDMRGLASGIFYTLLVAGVAVGAPLSGYLSEFFGFLWGILLAPIYALFTIATILLLVER